MGFGFRVSDFGFQVSGFGFSISGFGFRVSGVSPSPARDRGRPWFRVWGSGFRVQGLGFKILSLGVGFKVQGSGFRLTSSGFGGFGDLGFEGLRILGYVLGRTRLCPHHGRGRPPASGSTNMATRSWTHRVLAPPLSSAARNKHGDCLLPTFGHLTHRRGNRISGARENGGGFHVASPLANSRLVT